MPSPSPDTAKAGRLLLNVKELADALGVSERLVWRLRREGQLPPPIRLGSRVIRWDRRAIEKWIDRRCRAAAK